MTFEALLKSSAVPWLGVQIPRSAGNMSYFIIVETDDGNSIVECQDGQDPVTLAESQRGVLVDTGPFDSYEYACDVLSDLEPDNIELD